MLMFIKHDSCQTTVRTAEQGNCRLAGWKERSVLQHIYSATCLIGVRGRSTRGAFVTLERSAQDPGRQCFWLQCWSQRREGHKAAPNFVLIIGISTVKCVCFNKHAFWSNVAFTLLSDFMEFCADVDTHTRARARARTHRRTLSLPLSHSIHIYTLFLSLCTYIHTHTLSLSLSLSIHIYIYIHTHFFSPLCTYIYILAVPGHALLWPFPVTDWMLLLRSSTSLFFLARIARSPSQSWVPATRESSFDVTTLQQIWGNEIHMR
jgi:hypothetical protein